MNMLPHILRGVLGFAVLALGQGIAAEPLTTALAVRSLSAERAKEALPVRLRATVHFIESPGTVFVQDETSGTFLRTKLPLGNLRPGDIIEATGTTFPGLFLPGVETESFTVAGHGELPPAQPVTPDDLVSARYHYQRVSVEGIVRSVAASGEDKSVLRLAVGTRVIEVRLDAEPRGLDDARVRVTGLAAGTINDLRQLVQPYVRAAAWDVVEIIKPAPNTLEKLPVITPSQLLRFDAAGADGHRVLVRGEVTATFPKRRLLFMRDETGSIAVQWSDPPAQPGAVLTVPGFAEMQRFTPMLVDTGAAVHVESGAAPAAPVLRLAELPGKVRDGDLIQLSGTIAETYRSAEERGIRITDGSRSLLAVLEGEVPVQPGEQVQLTGIARVESVSGRGFNARPQQFSLWLREPSDVRIVRAPSPWTVKRLLTVLGALGLAGVAALVWIVLLRRQVAGLQQRVRHEAVLEERQRIAREFHDTLEQELAGLSLRLDAAASRPIEDKARALLDTSRSLVSRVQTEARNLVADLREDEARPLDLIAALDDLAGRQPAGAPRMRVELQGTVPALAAPMVHHLRMIAQEAVTNALKHARATEITLRLEAQQDRICLTVTDDGSGFDPNAQTQGKPGHFGCMGIRERCRKIGASVDWRSGPGKGTIVEVTCPL